MAFLNPILWIIAFKLKTITIAKFTIQSIVIRIIVYKKKVKKKKPTNETSKSH